MLVAGLCLPAGAVRAQAAPQEPADSDSISVEEVVVTGSRVIQDGSQAPTPLTVMNVADIQAAGVKDISEFVQEIPAVAGSWDMQSRSRQGSNGTLGLTSPALRNLGPNRTLVLLDGQRSVPTGVTGEVDTSTFPQMLINRVDVVTGGASAAYGSDAVAGVINYILDRDFTGMKGELSGGITEYGDDQNWRAQFAGGFPFAGGRGHILVSGEYSDSQGIYGSLDGSPPKRDWHYNPDVRVDNPAYTPTNGLPSYIILPDSGDPRATRGGLVFQCRVGTSTTNLTTACPIRGVAFAQNGGQPYQFNFGTVVFPRTTNIPFNNFYMSGGDWQASEMSSASTLDTPQEREGVFTRVSFDVTDNFNVFAQYSYNNSYQYSKFCCNFQYDIAVNVADNAYLPASVRQQAQAANVTQFTLGKILDGSIAGALSERWVNRYVVGAEGSFGLLGSDWKWNTYYQYGSSREDSYRTENILTAEWRLALDSVIDPATGTAVCRVKLTNPSSTCAPYNPFGWGVLSEATKAYIQTRPGYHEQGEAAYRFQRYRQDVAALSFSGQPFELWAGPVSLAFGGEYRKEAVRQAADARSLNREWLFAPFQATIGDYHVTEGFLETLIPLATDQAWARSLELNGAVRQTNYSTSGSVTTWKVGLSWTPIDDLRFRGTRSRDIRAPNISELYGAGTSANIGTINDPLFPGVPYTGQGFQITQGNPTLTPEIADVYGIGVVLQPRFLQGFTASVDYYNIKLADGIGNAAAGSQATIDQCYTNGITALCANITRLPDGRINDIFLRPVNFSKQINRGVDVEMSYRIPVANLVESWNGSLTFRWLATHYLEAYTDNGLTTPVNTVGQVSALPDWRHRFSVGYNLEPLSFSLAARAISSGTVNNSFIECDTGCPAATVDNRTIQVGGNQVAGFFLLDASATYKFGFGVTQNEFFLSVRNLWDKDPPRSPTTGSSATRGSRGTYDGTFDMLGRTYSAGLRIRF